MASTASRMQLVADQKARQPSLQHRKSIAFRNYLTAPRRYNPERLNLPQTVQTHVCLKRDQSCIWFAHLPPPVSQHLEMLAPDSPVRLLINGNETVWRRMKPGNGPTPGIRIDIGKVFWTAINIGSSFDLQTVPLLTEVESLKAAEQVSAGAEDSDQYPGSAIAGPTLFGAYLFIDYSGAEKVDQQRKAIRVAYGEGRNPASLVQVRHDRATLVEFILHCLDSASRRGIRVCLGQDHILGIPFGLARELGISHLPWRAALDAFLDGTYDPAAPVFHNVADFGRALNKWLEAHGHKPYFWSATKAKAYQLPNFDPRRGETDGCAYRLTDRCRSRSARGNPKPFNRLGDPGTVGGQSLLGMVRVRELIHRCEQQGIKLRFWPFDGLDITASEYGEAHVFVEPYPSALRPKGVQQTDANDALHTALAIQEADCNAYAADWFDLSGLPPADVATVLFEGWILGSLPSK